MKLQCVQYNIFAKNFQINIDEDVTKAPMVWNKDQAAFFRGIVNEDPNSVVSISVFEGELRGIIYSPSLGELNLGKLTNENAHIIYDVASMDTGNPFECGTFDDGKIYSKDQLQGAIEKAAGDIVDIFIEVDGDLTSAFGGASGVTNFITGLFN